MQISIATFVFQLVFMGGLATMIPWPVLSNALTTLMQTTIHGGAFRFALELRGYMLTYRPPSVSLLAPQIPMEIVLTGPA